MRFEYINIERCWAIEPSFECFVGLAYSYGARRVRVLFVWNGEYPA